MGVHLPASKDPSADVTSFFKVMIGDDFSEVMIFPPKFAKAVPNLINQEIQLEDASGRKWTVTSSKHKGFLAFQKGWHAFSVENDLKIGDFLVFEYLKHAHFHVTTYGRSGCEKELLPEYKVERKRKGRPKKFSGKNKLLRKTDSENVDEQHSVSSVVSAPNIDVNQSMPRATKNISNVDDESNPKVHSDTKCTEEPFYMINRDIGVGQGELRDSLYDLESLEMRPCSTGKNATIPNFKGEVNIVGKISESKEVKRCPMVPDVGRVAKSKIMEKSKDAGKVDDNTQVAKNDFESAFAYGLKQCSKTDSGKEKFSASQKQHTTFKLSDQISPTKISGGLNFSNLPATDRPGPYSSGQEQFSIYHKQQTTLKLSDQSSPKKNSGRFNVSEMPNSVKPEPTYSGGKKQFPISQKQQSTHKLSDQSSPKKTSGSLNFYNVPIYAKPEPYSWGKEPFQVSQKQQTPIMENGQSADNKFACGSDILGLPIANKPLFCSSNSLKEVKQQVEKKEGVTYGGPPGHQWTMKLDQWTINLQQRYHHEGNNDVPVPVKDEHPNIDVPVPVKDEPLDIIDFVYKVVVTIPSLETIEKQPYLVCRFTTPRIPQKLMQNCFDFSANFRGLKYVGVYNLGKMTIFRSSVELLKSWYNFAHSFLDLVLTMQELPDRLLPIPPKPKQRSERKLVVYLQGLKSSNWPVLYYERFGHKVLTNGWEAFRKANDIGPGDECVFGLKDANELIFKVKVIRKQ